LQIDSPDAVKASKRLNTKSRILVSNNIYYNYYYYTILWIIQRVNITHTTADESQNVRFFIIWYRVPERFYGFFFSFSLSDINPICRLLTNIISVYLHKCMSRSTNSGSNNICFYVPIVPSSCSAVNFTFNSTIKYLSYYSIWARSRVALVASRNERKRYT
jgi:hypothetical protein